MDAEVSDRLLKQRVRNRIMEELSILAGGTDELRQMGWEYLMCLLDWFPNASELNPAVGIMLPDEREGVAEVLRMVVSFAADAPRGATTDELIRLGRAEEIAPVAKRTLALLNVRGRFDEEHEEDEPSGGLQPL